MYRIVHYPGWEPQWRFPGMGFATVRFGKAPGFSDLVPISRTFLHHCFVSSAMAPVPAGSPRFQTVPCMRSICCDPIILHHENGVFPVCYGHRMKVFGVNNPPGLRPGITPKRDIRGLWSSGNLSAAFLSPSQAYY